MQLASRRLATPDLLDLTSSEQQRTINPGDHITSSQNKPHYLSKIHKN